MSIMQVSSIDIDISFVWCARGKMNQDYHSGEVDRYPRTGFRKQLGLARRLLGDSWTSFTSYVFKGFHICHFSLISLLSRKEQFLVAKEKALNEY